jgi:hydrogenase small subunit
VSGAASGAYGNVIRKLREITLRSVDTEPRWRAKGSELTTGYRKVW